MNPLFELPKDVTRVWDLQVPIIETDSAIEVYLADEIIEPYEYNELCYVLMHASTDQTVYLNITTPGGILDSSFKIIDAIQQSNAKVVARLSGTVASAGTVIALSCDDLIVADHTAWMSHNYSGGSAGKGHELKAYQEFTDKSLNDSFKQIHRGFFTERELKLLIDGKDFWMGKSEILERWANHKAARLLPPSAHETPVTPKRGRPRKS